MQNMANNNIALILTSLVIFSHILYIFVTNFISPFEIDKDMCTIDKHLKLMKLWRDNERKQLRE